MTTYKLLATCASGIEALVGKELKELGYETEVENGRARFEGTQKDIGRANIWLRTGDRVKIIIGEFDAKTFEELYQGVKGLPWEDYLPLNAEFPVAGRSQKSELFSVPDVQAITKKAIVDKLSEVYHRTGRLPETGAKYPLEVAINKDRVLITMDTTGPSLFKRGYRVDQGGAPLKENMAAALVLLTTWRPDRPFHDPMCGSGTIPIEAALIGHNLAPGANRSFQFQEWDNYEAELFEEVLDEADEAANYDIELDILGTDIDQSMIEIAEENARHAGLSQSITFKQMQVADFTTEKEFGIMVTNPPYGERLNDKTEVEKIYRDIGNVYRPLETWSKYILTSHLGFEDFYGEKATKRRKLYNGYLRTDLFQFWGKRK